MIVIKLFYTNILFKEILTNGKKLEIVKHLAVAYTKCIIIVHIYFFDLTLRSSTLRPIEGKLIL